MAKICVYAISKNEEMHVERFMASCKGADAVIVADTGSTDKTVEKLKALGATVGMVAVTPWRFDVARNESLKLVPMEFDWCICLDLDEVLVPGWREKMDKFIAEHPQVNRLQYHYVWGWKALPEYVIGPDGALVKKAEGVPDVEFTHDKHFHKRGTHNWFLPCHERLTCIWKTGHEVMGFCDIGVDHLADPSKSRGSYLGLLELGLKEYPNDDRTAHYLGREYYFQGKNEKAIETLKHHLSLNTAWLPERSASMRFMAECYGRMGDRGQQFRYLMAACGEAPGIREPWVALAEYYHAINDHLGCYYAAKKALEITSKPNTYINNSTSWSEKPYDLAGIHAYYIGLVKESASLSREALALLPGDARIVNNIKLADDQVARVFFEPEKCLDVILNSLQDVDQITKIAESLISIGQPQLAFRVAKRAIALVEPWSIQIEEERQTRIRIYDVAATAAWRSGACDPAIEYAQKAWELDKSNARLRCCAEVYWRVSGCRDPRPSAADIPRLSIKGLPGLEERDGTLEAVGKDIDKNRRIILFYPTVRPELAFLVLSHWKKTAANWDRVELKVVVKTKEQQAMIAQLYPNVEVCPESGVAKAANFAMQKLKCDDNPVIMTTFDDLFSPPGWDDWLTAVFKDYDGSILVNYNCDAALMGVPALSYACLLKLNRVLAHPSYFAQYSDTELFENLFEMGLLRNYRGAKNPVFDHKHWLNQKRTQDSVDIEMLQHGGVDQLNFFTRMNMPLAERLKL